MIHRIDFQWHRYLLSFLKLKFFALCTVLSLLLLSKDDIIVSVANAMLGTVNNTISDTLALIDSNDSEIGDQHEI